MFIFYPLFNSNYQIEILDNGFFILFRGDYEENIFDFISVYNHYRS